MKEDRCQEKVPGEGRFGCFHWHQCKKKVWKDGYCKIHHPDSYTERQAKSALAWQRKQENTPLARARKRIIELEKEIEILKGEKK